MTHDQMNLLFGMKFAPTQATGWLTTALSTLGMGFAVYEPVGIVAGVALGELPQLWKLLHEHHDQVDKELDAVIMVQSVWRSKKEHKKYQAVVGYVENCIWFFACVDSSLVFNGSVRADLILIFFLNLFFPLQLT